MHCRIVQSTSGGCKLQSAAQTNTMSSRIGIKLMGMVFLRIANHFIRPIARSTWILAFAIFFVLTTSAAVCCSIPELGGGISRLALRISNSELIVNPLSAKITSPGSTKFRKPDSLTICLSEARPPQPADKKLIMPLGAVTTKYVAVLWRL